MPGAPEELSLDRCGDAIAGEYLKATSRAMQPGLSGGVEAGQPLIMIVVPDTESRIAEDIQGVGINRYVVEHVDAVAVSAKQFAGATRVIPRLHIDRDVLFRLAAAYNNLSATGVKSWRWSPQLDNYYRGARKFSRKLDPFGMTELKELLSPYEAFHAAEWDLIDRTFKRKEPKKVVEKQRIDAKNSTVITGTVTNSFNTIQARDPELATALTEIFTYAQQSGNAEAKEIAEGVVDNVKAEKKTTARALWSGLLKALPSIASISSSVAKLEEWLG